MSHTLYKDNIINKSFDAKTKEDLVEYFSFSK